VRRRNRNGLVRERASELRLVCASQECAMDFIADGLADRRVARVLSRLDAFTRECLAVEAATVHGSVVTRVLSGRSRSAACRRTCDRTTDWSSHYDACAAGRTNARSNLAHIQPGRPMQNGHVETAPLSRFLRSGGCTKS
jgi:putative transposase